MKANFPICNSIQASHNLGFTITPIKRTREGDPSVSFSYNHAAPSYPGDVMPETSKQIQVGEGEGDAHLYVLTATGTVDDQATISVAGQSYTSPSGAGVEINGSFSNIKAGFYTVSVSHTNIDYPPKGNVSFLNCTVGPASAISITPDENDPPQECECDCPPCSCNSDGETSPGGPPPSGSGPARKHSSLRRFSSNLTSTSGGSGVRRQSSVNDMAWSAQFGVFRGISHMPAGRLEILAHRSFSPNLFSPAGLALRHPLATSLALPEGGMAPNTMVALLDGASYTNYMLDGTGSVFFPVGASGITTTILAPVSSMSREAGSCNLEQAAYIRASYAGGSSAFYSLSTGQCEGYISPGGYLMTASEAENYLAIVRDEHGVIRQIWNTWDGLADVLPLDKGGYAINIYAPSQIMEPEEEGTLFTAEGTPVKIFTVTGDETLQTLAISERDNTLPASMPDFVTTWTWAGEAWSMTEGTGEDAVETRRERLQPEGTSQETRYRDLTRLMKNGVEASCTLEEYETAATGEHLLSRTEGYGSKGALTTIYSYDDSGRLISSVSLNAGEHKTVYDTAGRPVLENSPWGANGLRTVRTKYRDNTTGYSSEPAEVKIQLSTASAVNTLSLAVYTYTEENHVKRVEKRETAAGSSVTQLSVTETWLASATNAYAAGRLKMEQAVNGVQTHYTYAPVTDHGALYSVTAETRINGEPVPGQSTRRVSYITAEGNTAREENFVLLPTGMWKQTGGASYAYDLLNRRVETVRDNGRTSSRALTCTGDLLWEINEDGVRTDYTYDTARRLIETTRSEISDGTSVITPETITAYERDAAGRVVSTTTHIGPMRTTETTSYDLLGRVTRRTDALGRVTTTSYSEDGLTATTTTPSGATLVNTYNTDESIAHESGTGQRKLYHVYDFIGGLRHTTRLADNATILMQEIQDGFGQTITLTTPTTLENTYLYTRSVYNALGQLTRRTEGALAPVAYEYDSMGNLAKQTVVLNPASPADATKNRIQTFQTAWEEGEDGIYQTVATTRNNAAGNMLNSAVKQLVTESAVLQNKQITIDERGHESIYWTEYGQGTVRLQKSAIPTSNMTAAITVVDGFTTIQTDDQGITSTFTRRYTETGIVQTVTDGRGNTSTTRTDIAGRPVTITDAAGNMTSTLYCATSDNPATVTDALGNTVHYAYDVRNRKTAEYGTAIQPALFAWDDADRLVSLTIFRIDGETIISDPSDLTGGDTTVWTYHDATGLELGKVYANGQGTVRTYDANNRVATETDARGIIATYTWNAAQGLRTRISFSDDTPEQTFSYNILGQLTQVTDASGIRTFSYNEYSEPVQDNVTVNGTIFPLVEAMDDYGRSIGYILKRGASGNAQITSWSYAPDGRINSASFEHNGQNRIFEYSYLAGSNLLEILTLPNGMTLEQNYEAKRDLLANMDYNRGTTLVSRRSYAYDALGRPTARTLLRQGTTRHDVFSYNGRSELTAATLGTNAYAYDYDNIGNRKTAQEIAEEFTYAANELNQYTSITHSTPNSSPSTLEQPFVPSYDADGNQTKIKTATGVWTAEYNALNRPVRFTHAAEDGTVTTVTGDYDYMGRRIFKKVERTAADPETGESTTSTILNHRYLYRGYLQIAALDLTRSTLNALWYILWDPTQSQATRPLAIQTARSWFTYGWDLTKNIMELYDSTGHLSASYSYSPFGSVTSTGSISQPIQWNSEMFDAELGLVYYNYRHYNSHDGRWTSRDPIGIEGGFNLFSFLYNSPIYKNDYLGLKEAYRFCSLLEEKPEAWGKTVGTIRKPSITFLGFPIVYIEEKQKLVTRIFCKFRCWKNRKDNCYRVPCRCSKDHGVEVTVRIKSTGFDFAADFCSSVEAQVTLGKLDGGAIVIKNYKR
ncbi:RHS repeat-associated core domain-containing protein [Akkermansia sp.]|uniref:RHS repeat domain-containing protein n=1 Tax=Akkermansia sp. TaxID=1872421 RepID=UPI0025B8394E|nr:RHS repeat-associated core domain-containing protein [Akkermansia sp.]